MQQIKMSYLRNRLLQSYFRCNSVISQRLSARICTTVPKVKAETPGDGVYPFMTKYKNNQHRVEDTFKAANMETWKYQPHVILGCLAIFLFYFLFWREENNVDVAIAKIFYEASPEMEIFDLQAKIKKKKKKGQDTTLDEDRLNFLLAPKSK